MIYTNNREAVFAHGAVIRECFPELTDQTIKLAEEAMKGMLVLPGTGPELYFVGNPPKWTENPVNDNEYTFHLNRMHHLKTLAEAYGLTGNLTYAQKANCKYHGTAGTRQQEVSAQLHNAFPVSKKLLSQLYFIRDFCFASPPDSPGGDFLQLFIEMQQ